MARKQRNIVTFELPPAMLKMLQDDADARGSASHHKRAREIVVEMLSNGEVGELRAAIAEVDCNVAYLKDLVCRVAYSVIVHAAKRPSKEANEWIRENMPKNP